MRRPIHRLNLYVYKEVITVEEKLSLVVVLFTIVLVFSLIAHYISTI
jgi:hypothetical protein